MTSLLSGEALRSVQVSDDDYIGFCPCLITDSFDTMPSSDDDNSVKAASPQSSSKPLSPFRERVKVPQNVVIEQATTAKLKKGAPNGTLLPTKRKEEESDFLLVGFEKLFGLAELTERNAKVSPSKEITVSCRESTIEETTSEESLSATIDEKTEEVVAGAGRDVKTSEGNYDKSTKGSSLSHNPKEAPETPPLQVGDTKDSEKQPEGGTQQSAINEVCRKICFEMEHVGVSTATMVFYCMAHMTIYELIYSLLLETTEGRISNWNLFYGSLMVFGLVLMRFTGFLWHFLTTKKYRQTRRELKERRKTESWDAQIHDWLEERTYVRIGLEVLAFYLWYISISFFWSKFLGAVVDQRGEILGQLPSVLHRKENPAGNAGVSETCSKSWEAEDYAYLYKTVAKNCYYQYMGSADTPLFNAPVGILVNVVTAALSIYFLSKTGLTFEDTW